MHRQMSRLVALIAAALMLATSAACGDAGQSLPASPTVEVTPNASASPAAAAVVSPTPPATVAARIPGPVLPPPSWSHADAIGDFSDTRTYLLGLTTGTVSALGVAPSSPADVHASIVAWSPTSQVLVSVWDPGGVGPTGVIRQRVTDLYVGDPNGASMRHLITVRAFAFGADWSPDGTLIALHAGSSVLVVEAASGSVIADLSPPDPSGGAWSGDGHRLAIESQYLGVNTITLWDRDDGSTQTISGFYAAWAPQSNRLAFVAGSRAPGPQEQPVELRVRDTDSGSEEVVGSLASASVYPWLTWSPGGRFVAMNVRIGSAGSIHLFDTTGSRGHTIIHEAAFGSWIDDSSLAVTGNACSTMDVLIASVDGSLRNVTNSPNIQDGFPVASPDGHSLALTRGDVLGRSNLALVSLPGGAVRDLVTKTTPYYIAPGAWSRDGRYLVFNVLGGRDGPCLQGGIPDTSVEVVQ